MKATALLAAVVISSLPLCGGCKRDADAPLPKGALFPDVPAAAAPAPGSVAGVLDRVVELREREPNDDLGNAMAVGDNAVVIAEIAGTRGQAAPAQAPPKGKRPPRRLIDVDWYQLPEGGEPGRITRIELRDAPGCAGLSVYDEADGARELVSTTSERRVRPVIDGLRRDGRPLWVKVQCRARQAPDKPEAGYRLALSTRPRGPEEEAEPNEALGPHTQVLTLGQVGQATLATRRDVDLFRLDLGAASAGEAIALSVAALPGVALEVSLLDPTAEKVLLTRRPGRGEGVVIPNLDRQRTGDLVTLKIAALSGVAPDTPYAATAHLLLPEGCPAQAQCADRLPVEREPNDSRETAMAIAPGGLLTGIIDGPGEVDWYVVDVAPGQVASVELTPPEGLGLTLQVGEGAQPWATLSAEAPGQPVVMPGWLPSAQRFYLQVAAAGDAFDRGRSYALKVRARQQAPYEREPQGGQAPAESLAQFAGAWQMQGALVPAGDVDRFRLDLTLRSAPLQGDLLCGSDGRAGLSCAILREDNTVAAMIDAPAAEGEVGRVTMHLPPAMYFVQVSAATPRVSRSTYRVEVLDKGALAAALADPVTPDAALGVPTPVPTPVPAPPLP